MKTTLLSLILATSVLIACTDSTPTATTANSAPACADEKAALMDGLGEYGRDINSASPEAQAFFNQGLNLTFSYYFPEALASFNAALCHDASNPMIHWGRALAIAPNPNSRYFPMSDDPSGAGREAINQATQLAADPESGLDAPSRGLIQALSELFATDKYPDQGERSAAFIAATQSLYQQFPQDLEVAFLAADAIMMATPWQYFSTNDGSPMNRADEAQVILEQGIAQNPNHPGLNHLYIHLMENSFEPERAEAAADRLEALTPKAGHMVHMPGHIYIRLGRYADGIATNQRSLQADEYFAAAWGERPLPTEPTLPISHRSHGPHADAFIHWAAVLQGNSKLALETIKPMAERMGGAVNSGRAQAAIVKYWMTLRFFKRWDDIMAIELIEDAPPYLEGMWHFVRGSAFVAAGDLDAARREMRLIRSITNDKEALNYRASVNNVGDLLVIASDELAGAIGLARGNHPRAIDNYKYAVAGQDRLRYMEPPDWLQSTRLGLAQAYMEAGNFAAAEAVYLKDLELLRDNGWALHGLLLSLQAQNKTEEAAEVQQRFNEAWQYADVDIAEL